MTDQEKTVVNNLLALLHSFEVLRLVTEEYTVRHKNTAPAVLVKDAIAKVRAVADAPTSPLGDAHEPPEIWYRENY